MNLLLVNHYAGSPALGMEYRPYYLAREWVRAGHRVQIVAASFSHVRNIQPELPNGGRRTAEEVVDGVSYRWLLAPPYKGNGVGRLKNIWAFLSLLWLESHRIVGQFKPDAVVASSTYPMDIWIARRLARIANAALVYEVHDLWPASPMELSGMSKWHPFILLCQKAENDAYRDADVVVSMLPNVAVHMASHGLDLRKLHIVPNGVAHDEWLGQQTPLASDLAARLGALKALGHRIVGYAGSHGLPNALDFLIDAAALLRDRPISFVLVGDGHEKARLERRVRDERLDHVVMLPPIPKAQIPALLNTFDVAYIGWQRAPIYRFGIAPNKLMDYMMAGCTVLHSVEAGNDPVAEAGCGLTVAPESATEVADGVRSLLALSPAERTVMGERGRDFVLAHHTYAVLAKRFTDAVVPALKR